MIKIITVTAVLSILLVLVVFGVGVYQQFGAGPNPDELASYERLDYFNSAKKEFENIDANVVPEMEKNMDGFAMFKKMFFPENKREPLTKLPEIKPDWNVFNGQDEDKLIWFGHSSFLLRAAGKNILIDPVFSNYASPVPAFVKRFQKPVVDMKDLPKIDLVLISHDHYDHLDMKSVKFFKNDHTKFLVPKGVGSRLKGWGIDKKRIIEKAWWEEHREDAVKFIATPSQHFSGRAIRDRNKTLWASWVIKTPSSNIYYSGDSGYGGHFKEIGDKLGPFSYVLMENGQYNENWRPVHLMPEEGFKAFTELKGESFIPAHWGMFILSFHTWREPMDRISNIVKQNNLEQSLVTPKIGEILTLNRKNNTTNWWETIQ